MNAMAEAVGPIEDWDADRFWSGVSAVIPESGLELQLIPGRCTRVPALHGHYSRLINLDYLVERTELAEATLDILASSLSVLSLPYACEISRVVRRAFLEGSFNPDSPIGLDNVMDWAECGRKNQWSAMKYYLRRLADIGTANLVSDEVRELTVNGGPFGKLRVRAYESILINDIRRGALDDQEMASILTELERSFQSGGIGLSEHVFVRFLIATGIRPIQLARLTPAHFAVKYAQSGSGPEVIIRLPLAKEGGRSKTAHVLRRAPAFLAEPLVRLLETVDSVRLDAPLFFETGSQVRLALKRIFSKLDTWSERCRGPIPITPYRFRHTFATKLLEEGASDDVAAFAMTHRTIKPMGFYRDSRASLQSVIEDAVAEQLEPFAGTFSGRLLSDSDSTEEGADAVRIVRSFERHGGVGFGVCGQDSECHQDAPRACLTCWKFQPFADAPFHLLETEIRDDLDGETSPRIRRIRESQLDALEQVFAACRQLNGSKSEEVK